MPKSGCKLGKVGPLTHYLRTSMWLSPKTLTPHIFLNHLKQRTDLSSLSLFRVGTSGRKYRYCFSQGRVATLWTYPHLSSCRLVELSGCITQPCHAGTSREAERLDPKVSYGKRKHLPLGTVKQGSEGAWWKELKQFVDSGHHLNKQDLTPWQDSPGHTANLLDKKFRRHNGPHWGRLKCLGASRDRKGIKGLEKWAHLKSLHMAQW